MSTLAVLGLASLGSIGAMAGAAGVSSLRWPCCSPQATNWVPANWPPGAIPGKAATSFRLARSARATISSASNFRSPAMAR